MANYGFTVNVDGNVLAQTKKIEEALHSMGITAKVEVEKAEHAFGGFGEKMSETFGGLKKLILGSLGIAAAFEGIEFVKASKEAFDAFEESVAKVNAALASTRGVAGKTEEELIKGAKELGSTVLFSRASIVDAQSMLLTFTSIRGEIFDKTLPAITNFATRFKMDLPAAANALGKALNDPLKGMTRLQRQGVVFSESQKEVIKKFMETGQIAKAQKVILGELETEFGGLATAMAKTDEGKIAMAKKGWGDIKLTIGELVSKLEVALIPVLTTMIKIVKGIGSMFTSSSVGAIIFRDAIIGIGTALAIYYTYLGLAASWTAIVTAAQWAWNAAMQANPIVWIIDAIVALIVIVGVLWDKFEGFRAVVGGVFGFVKQQVATMIHVFVNLATVIGDVFTGKFKKAWEDGKNALKELTFDLSAGMVDAVKKGADAAAKSDFKFSNLLKFGTGQEGPSKEGKEGKDGKGGNGFKDNAMNTSDLGGAKGGLGEAKIIHITFNAPLQEIKTADPKSLRALGQDAVETIVRTLNNVAYSQSSTQ